MNGILEWIQIVCLLVKPRIIVSRLYYILAACFRYYYVTVYSAYGVYVNAVI